MSEMSKYCEDCVHNEVCQYGAHCPTEHCNDKNVAEDYVPTAKWLVAYTGPFGNEIQYCFCSNCQKEGSYFDKYCRYCGAKIKGEGE